MTNLKRARHLAHPRRRVRRSTIAGALLLVVAVVISLITLSGNGGPKRPAVRTRAQAASRSARTFLGPDGVESTAVVAENRLPGTTAWQITNQASSGFIEGFADTTYAAQGGQVGLYVSTSANSFRVIAYRMGYYGGKGGRQVWGSGTLSGVQQPACPVVTGINMVDCDSWSLSLTVQITSAFPSGDYLFKLIGSGDQQSYVPLTVWDPTSTSTYVIMARSLTEQGWNTFGGYSFYQGEGPCPPGSGSYPPCNRARVVSFDRPYSTGNGAADFLGDEFPLVYYAEEQGLDVTYGTDVTVNDHPSMLLQHKALLSLGHDETWTWPELQGVEIAIGKGLNVAFMGAAAIVRHARLQASPLGPDQEEVDYRDSSEDPLNGVGSADEVTGNTWASPPTDISTSGLVGQIYSGYLEPNEPPAALVVWDADAWIFKGTGLVDGSKIPGVISSDIDHVDPSQPMPADLEVLGHSPIPLSEAYTNQGEWGGDTYSDMTYYTDRSSKAGIFDSGTVNWINAMAPPCSGEPAGLCPSPLLGEITGNLFWLFGQGPAGDVVPSTANWQSVTPSGS